MLRLADKALLRVLNFLCPVSTGKRLCYMRFHGHHALSFGLTNGFVEDFLLAKS